MDLHFDPILVSFGTLSVRWFGVLALLGILSGALLTLCLARERGFEVEPVVAALVWGVPAGIVTARVFHVLSGWDYYLTRPEEILQVPLGGLSLWGGLLGGTLAAAWRLRADPLLRIRLADLATLGMLLAIVFGRIGSFVNGDGQGLVSDLPWATRYTNTYTTAPDFIYTRHPAQLYDGLAALVLLMLLWRVPVSAPTGTRFWSFLALYGLARIALGELLLEPRFLFGLQLDQLAALAAVFVGVTQLLVAAWRHRPVRAKLTAPDSTTVPLGVGK